MVKKTDIKNLSKNKNNVIELKKIIKKLNINEKIDIKLEDNPEEYVYRLLDILYDNINNDLMIKNELLKKEKLFNKTINKNDIK